jgi:hypothetical protein
MPAGSGINTIAAVIRDGTRPLAALIAALLAAALLAACGGSSSDSTSATDAGSTSSTATGTTSPQDNGSGNSGSQGQDSGQGQSGGGQSNQSQGQQNSSGSKPKDVATPLTVSGGGSEQFRSKGGDNSIQEFGEESDESELQEAAEVVHDFYVARVQEEWSKACSYLAKPNIEQLEQIGTQAPKLKDAGCAAILEAFTRPLAAAVRREITTVDAGSLRREDDQGFLVYYGTGHTAYAMPLRDEDGSWKIAALSGTTLD